MSAGAASVPTELRPVRGLLCDLFGTLVPGGGGSRRAEAAQLMGDALGVDGAALDRAFRESYDERMRGRLGSLEETVRTLARRLGADPSHAAVRRTTDLRVELLGGLLEPFPGTLDALDALRASGLRLALCSDCSGEIPLAWPRSPLAARFDAAAFSSEVGLRKPATAMYRAAFAPLGLAPRDCAFVGDGGSRELTGAAALGMQAWLLAVSGAADDRSDPDHAWAGGSVASLSELAGRLAAEPAGARAR